VDNLFGPLHAIFLELKTSTRSFPFNLRGGAHGYVGCILSPVTYATITPLNPFITPLHTGP